MKAWSAFARSASRAILVFVLLGAGLEVHAGTTVEIIWTATTGSGTPGSASIDAAPGDRLTGEVRISSSDRAGVAAYGISLSFDTDLGDELQLESVVELLPVGFTHNLTLGPEATQESTAGQQGGIRTLEALSLVPGGTGLASAVAAEVTFRVTANVATDGEDVFTGAFSPGVDAVGDGDDVDITAAVVFQGASVNQLAPVPIGPPWIGPALALWLGGLGALSARRRQARQGR